MFQFFFWGGWTAFSAAPGRSWGTGRRRFFPEHRATEEFYESAVIERWLAWSISSAGWESRRVRVYGTYWRWGSFVVFFFAVGVASGSGVCVGMGSRCFSDILKTGFRCGNARLDSIQFWNVFLRLKRRLGGYLLEIKCFVMGCAALIYLLYAFFRERCFGVGREALK